MRIALTTAMLLAATLVCAEEPSSADAKPTPAAEATQASPSEQAAEPAATEQATAADEESTATEKAADAALQAIALLRRTLDEAAPMAAADGQVTASG